MLCRLLFSSCAQLLYFVGLAAIVALNTLRDYERLSVTWAVRLFLLEETDLALRPGFLGFTDNYHLKDGGKETSFLKVLFRTNLF